MWSFDVWRAKSNQAGAASTPTLLAMIDMCRHYVIDCYSKESSNGALNDGEGTALAHLPVRIGENAMAFVPTEHGALVVARFKYSDEEWSNHLWARRPDFDDTDLQNLVDAVKAAFVLELIDDFTVSTSMLPFKAYDMRAIDGTVLLDTVGTVPGTGGTNEMPPNNCCVLTLYTAKRGRSHRGRLYLGPFTEEAIDNATWSASLVSEVEGLGTALKADISAEGFEWGVRSGQLDGVPRDPAIITPITSTTVRSNRMGSQRRRVDRA